MFDASDVVKAIEGNEDWFLRNLVQDIIDLLECFVSFKINHISRNVNWGAHDIAKFCFNLGEDFEWFDSFLD